VVDESIRVIFEAEKKAREQTEAAQREVATILESTRKEAEELKRSEKVETKAKAEKVIRESREKAEADVQELLKKNLRQIQAMERKARARHAEAIKLVLDAILG